MLDRVLRRGSRSWLAGIQVHVPSPGNHRLLQCPSCSLHTALLSDFPPLTISPWRPSCTAILWSLLLPELYFCRGTGSTELWFGAHCWSINVLTVWDGSQGIDMAVGQPLQLRKRMALREMDFGRAESLNAPQQTETSNSNLLFFFCLLL